jgi:hypothetical protein
MYKPMDTEAKALINKYKHHIKNTYNIEYNRNLNEVELQREFAKLREISAVEFTSEVWEELNQLMNPEQYEDPAFLEQDNFYDWETHI